MSADDELLGELREMAATVDPPPAATDAGTRWYALDVLARLATEDLLAVVDVVAQAKLLGDAWLQVDPGDGRLRARDTTAVRIEERASSSSPPPPSSGPAPGG